MKQKTLTYTKLTKSMFVALRSKKMRLLGIAD